MKALLKHDHSNNREPIHSSFSDDDHQVKLKIRAMIDRSFLSSQPPNMEVAEVEPTTEASLILFCIPLQTVHFFLGKTPLGVLDLPQCDML